MYVDDLGSVFIPSLYNKFKNQLAEIENRINNDLDKLRKYATEWHQPVNSKKTEYIIFFRIVKRPKLKIIYNDNQIEQKKNFKYLGYRLDSKLSLNSIASDICEKSRQTYSNFEIYTSKIFFFLQAQTTFF